MCVQKKNKNTQTILNGCKLRKNKMVTRPGHSFLQFQIKYTAQMTLDESNLPSYVCLSLHKRTTMEMEFKKM